MTDAEEVKLSEELAGAVLAAPAKNADGGVLLSEGAELSEHNINALLKRGVKTVTIQSQSPSMSPEQGRQAIVRMNRQFASFSNNKTMMLVRDILQKYFLEKAGLGDADVGEADLGKADLGKDGDIPDDQNNPEANQETQNESEKISLTDEMVRQKLAELPSFSAALTDLLQAMDAPQVDMSAIADKLLLDPVLAGRVLQMANSSFYGFAREVTSVQEACVILGHHTIRNLVYSLVVMSRFDNESHGGHCDVMQVWKHSLLVASLAKSLANEDQQTAQSVYLTGLFHDLGIIVLDYFWSQEFSSCMTSTRCAKKSLLQCESQFFGLNHYDISAIALEFWNFPQDVVETIRQLTSAKESMDRTDALINVSNLLAQGLGVSSLDDMPLTEIDPQALSTSKIDLTCLRENLGEAESLYNELLQNMF